MLTRIQGVKSTDSMISNYAKPSQQTFLQTDTFIRNPFCLVSSYNYWCLRNQNKHLPGSESCAYDFFALQKEAGHPPLLLLLSLQTRDAHGGFRLHRLVPHHLFPLCSLYIFICHFWFFSAFLSCDVNLVREEKSFDSGAHLCLTVPHCALLHHQLKGWDSQGPGLDRTHLGLTEIHTSWQRDTLDWLFRDTHGWLRDTQEWVRDTHASQLGVWDCQIFTHPCNRHQSIASFHPIFVRTRNILNHSMSWYKACVQGVGGSVQRLPIECTGWTKCFSGRK